MKFYTDNQNVVRIASKGSMCQDLHQLAMSIYGLCLAHSIHMEVQWIPRDLNTVADELSKQFDFDDWSVDELTFQYFNKRWGPFTCDLFADC